MGVSAIGGAIDIGAMFQGGNIPQDIGAMVQWAMVFWIYISMGVNLPDGLHCF